MFLCKAINNKTIIKMSESKTKSQNSKKIKHIMNRLTTLHGLNGGYKLWLSIDPETNEKRFDIDNSYFPSISRYLGSQNRESIVSTIDEDVDFLFKHYKCFNCENKTKKCVFLRSFSDCISKALDGIGNMRQTYSTHANQITLIIDKLLSIKNDTEKELDELEKSLK